MTDAALAIDLGTSNTVAAVRRPGGRTEQVLFDGSPVLPSAVFGQDDGTLLVGRDALHAAASAPERLEPNPKLRIDDGTVLLGTEMPVPELFAAVLRRVAEDADRCTPGDIGTVVLTHPVAWGTRRQQTLVRAAELAGLPEPILLAEPIAAARHHLADTAVDHTAPLIVYDLGGGTHDVSVVHRDQVLASDGLADTGGLDIDAAILAHLDATYRHRNPDAWARLRHPATTADQRHRRHLLDQVRTAKELLSRSAQTFVHIPLLELDAPLGREQLDAIAQPVVDRTVRATRAALAAAGLDLPPRAALYLTGGASRMPLVASTLHRALRVPPAVTEQPELAVARGALVALGPNAGPREPAAHRVAVRPDPRSAPHADGAARSSPHDDGAARSSAADRARTPPEPSLLVPQPTIRPSRAETANQDAEHLPVLLCVTTLAGGLLITSGLIYASDLAWWAAILCAVFNTMGAVIVWAGADALIQRFRRHDDSSNRATIVIAAAYYLVTTVALLIRAS